jgi:tripartite-type tricarboxylate transporter receptor subunit TctC
MSESAGRRAIQAAIIAVAVLARCNGVEAQTYPSQPVKIVVGFAPGGTNDVLARLMADRLTAKLGQPFIVENRPGAANNIGTEAVARAKPDGYTLLMANAPNAINHSLYDKLGFNFLQDIAPVAGIMRVPNVIVAHPSFPAKTLKELIATAKASPDKVNLATPGVGSSTHVAAELLKMMTECPSCTCPIAGPRRCSRTCSAAGCCSASTTCPARSSISAPARCARWR